MSLLTNRQQYAVISFSRSMVGCRIPETTSTLPTATSPASLLPPPLPSSQWFLPHSTNQPRQSTHLARPTSTTQTSLYSCESLCARVLPGFLCRCVRCDFHPELVHKFELQSGHIFESSAWLGACDTSSTRLGRDLPPGTAHHGQTCSNLASPGWSETETVGAGSSVSVPTVWRCRISRQLKLRMPRACLR